MFSAEKRYIITIIVDLGFVFETNNMEKNKFDNVIQLCWSFSCAVRQLFQIG